MKSKTFLWLAASLLFAFVLIPHQSCKKEMEPQKDLNQTSTNSTIQEKSGSLILYYGHEIFTRGTGEPVIEIRQITNENHAFFENDFTLLIRNGDGTNNMVSSAVIKIDGEVVVDPSAFSQQVSQIVVDGITLNEDSELSVELRGAPGGFVELWIEGEMLPDYAYITDQGGAFWFDDSTVFLTVPPNALPSYGVAFLGQTGNEPTSVPNPSLEICGTPMTLQLSASSLLLPIQLSYPKPSGSITFEDYSVFLFNGSSYFPIEYSFSDNRVIAIIDQIDWESVQSRGIDGMQIIIFGVQVAVYPPAEWMGLNEATIGGTGMISNPPSLVNPSSRIFLMVHGAFGSPTVWDEMIPALQEEFGTSDTYYWTFGYSSFKSIEHNAEILEDFLSDHANGAQIDIIAHSMGGLVSRSMIEQYGGSIYVNRLVTLGSPLQGSLRAALRDRIGNFVAEAGPIVYFIYYFGTQGFRDVQTNSTFIQQMMGLGNPPIPYYTIACTNEPLYGTNECNGSLQIPSLDDGFVSVVSAKGIAGENVSAPDSDVNIPDCNAHTMMTKNDEIQDQVIDYLSINGLPPIGQPCPGTPTVTDADGNIYNTVQVGDQCWMAENLNYEVDNSWCYDNDPSNCETYGRLYTWYTMMNGEPSSNAVPSGVQGICPVGWHVPSDEEWKILEGTVDSQYGVGDPEWDLYGGRGSDVGYKLKSTYDWWSGWGIIGPGSDAYGFAALPGGSAFWDGTFNGIKFKANFWTSTEPINGKAFLRGFYYSQSDLYRGGNFTVEWSSVRCLKD